MNTHESDIAILYCEKMTLKPMKRILLILVFCICSVPAGWTQNIFTTTNFPDANFRAAVQTFMGSGSFTAAQAAARTGSFDCSNQNIASLQGIEFFTGLSRLYCNNNQLTTLDLSLNAGLNTLHCENNQLTSLTLGVKPALQYLFCQANSLSTLDLSGAPNLSTVHCYSNNLTSLDVSNKTSLAYLFCQNNQLSTLNLTGCSSLYILYCYNNNLSGALDLSNHTALGYVSCMNNQITSLNLVNNLALVRVNARSNNLTDISGMASNPGLDAGDAVDVSYNNLDCGDWTDVTTLSGRLGANMTYSPQNGMDPYNCSIMNVNINTPAEFPDPNFRSAVETFMGVGPGGPFTAAQAASKTGTLNASGRNIVSASGIQYFTNLNRILIQNNQLTSLDLSANTALDNVHCENNQLASLNVSTLSAMVYLFCQNNQLTSLTLPASGSLSTLHCYSNKLTSLNLSNQANLLYVFAQGNQIASVNAAGAPSLFMLYLYNNKITGSLDLSGQTSLNYLLLQTNLLTGLTLAPNSPIVMLNLRGNQIADVAGLAANTGLNSGDTVDLSLNNLDCNDWADVSALKSRVGALCTISPQNTLDPYDCALMATSINTPQNFPDANFRTAIEQFMGVGPGGPFTAAQAAAKTGLLDVSGKNIASASGIQYFTGLNRLFINGNQLTSLNVSALSALQNLHCENNQLASLDVSNNAQLVYLFCQSNQLTSLTLAGADALSTVHCYNNKLTSLDASGKPSLVYLMCYNNLLTSLNVAGSTGLYYLSAYSNKLTEIDVTSNPAIKYVFGNNNLIPSLVNFVNAAGLNAGDTLDVRTNRLTEDDLADINTLKQRLGANFTYTITDTQPPVINCPSNITVNAANASGSVVSFPTPAATDLLDPSPVVTVSPKSGSLFPLGNTTVSVVASDVAGNTSTCSFIVSVTDGAAPQIECPADVAVEAAGPNGAVVNYSAPAAFDVIDPNPTVVSDPASGSQFSLGDTVVTSVATDFAGNSSVCTFTVHVVDTAAPVIAAVSDVVVEANTAGGAVVAYTTPSVSDLVDANPAVTFSPVSGSYFAIGDTVVSCTAIDASGNIAAATFTIGVTDTTAPQITLGGPSTISLESNVDSYSRSVWQASVSDAGDPGVQLVIDDASVNTSQVGTYTVAFSATDAYGNAAAPVTRTVNVVDSSAPVFEPVSDITVEADAAGGAPVTYTPPSATDLDDPNPTVTCVPAPGSFFALGDTTVTCTATDAAGNESTTTFIITVEDTTAPAITLGGPSSLTLECNVDSYTRGVWQASVSDAADAGVQLAVNDAAVNPAQVGTYTVTFNATDASGNAATPVTRTVYVVDTTKPVFASVSNQTVEANAAGGATVAFTTPSATDLTDPNPVIECNPVSGSFFALGDTVVSCTAIDASGNIAAVTFTISVTDTTAPQIALGGPSSLTLECNVDSYSRSVWQASVSDAADAGVQLAVNDAAVNPAQVGTYTVTFNAIDASGNAATPVTRTVNVVDTTKPVLSSVSNLTVEANAAGGASVTFTAPTATDLADPNPMVTCNPVSGTFFSLGQTTVTCTATDASGNSATTSFVITVQDTTAPVITLGGPSSLTLECNVDSYSRSVWQASVSDVADPGVQLVVNDASVNPAQIGTYTVTFNATDASGNAATPVTRTVNVVDTTKPVLSTVSNLTVEANAAGGAPVTFTAPTATDLVDPNPTVTCNPASGTFFALGQTTVTCTATDASGNSATITFIITVQDTTAPVITLGGPSSLTLECNVDSYSRSVWQASVSDVADSSVQLVVNDSTVNTAQVGTYTVTFNATDASGNAATPVTRTVNVVDTTKPVISGANDVVQSQASGCPAQTSVTLNVSVSDLADPSPAVVTTFNYANGSLLTRPGLPGSTENFPLGTSVVTVTSTDASQNQAAATFYVTIISNSTLIVTVKQIASGQAALATGLTVNVYDASSGSAAVMADGNAANGAPASSFAAIYQSVTPVYTGQTNANGTVTLPVMPGSYVAIVGVDTDNNGILNLNDTYIGAQALNLTCGETRYANIITHTYAVFASHSLALKYKSSVTGDVGAQTSASAPTVGTGEVDLQSQVTITGSVYGDSVNVGYRSKITGDVWYNDITLGSRVNISGQQIHPVALPIAGPFPTAPVFVAGSQNVSVSTNQTVTLTPGNYGTIAVASGWNKNIATLKLEPGVYNIDSLQIGDLGKLRFLGPCAIRIQNRLSTGWYSDIAVESNQGLTARDVLIYVKAPNGGNGQLGDTPSSVSLGSGSTFQGRVFAPFGTISIGYNATVRGVYAAKWVDVDGRVDIEQ
ncbi:MAG: HYR domain-containing protein [bacterium]|nr:HYR domain-containing protein [bacterium]